MITTHTHAGALGRLAGDQKSATVLLAYEPVWAIGAGGTPASSDYADERHAKIIEQASDIMGQRIRAAHVHDAYSAAKASTSNNAQVITMGARGVGTELAKTIVDAWLATSFDENGPSADNVKALDQVDAEHGCA